MTTREAFEAWWNTEGKYKSQPKENCFRAWQEATKQAERVPSGWRLLKDSTQAERSFPEDRSNENGSYQNECFNCQRVFIGHKCRMWCRVCTAAPTQPEDAVLPDTGREG